MLRILTEFFWNLSRNIQKEYAIDSQDSFERTDSALDRILGKKKEEGGIIPLPPYVEDP
jgi:hypothetical protein